MAAARAGAFAGKMQRQDRQRSRVFPGISSYLGCYWKVLSTEREGSFLQLTWQGKSLTGMPRDKHNVDSPAGVPGAVVLNLCVETPHRGHISGIYIMTHNSSKITVRK